MEPTTAIAVIEPTAPEGPADEAAPSIVVVPPAPVAADIAAIIARLDARNADIIRHSAEVLTYERKRPPVSMVGRDTRSQRPMCAGCGYGIRQETRKVPGPDGVYHPNCAKVAAGVADSSKISPRYLAAIVPLTQIRIADLRALPAPIPAVQLALGTPDGDAEPAGGAVEDETTDLVQEAVAKSNRGGRGRKNRSA